MNGIDVPIARLIRDEEVGRQRSRPRPFRSAHAIFLRIVCAGAAVTFLVWHTYPVDELTLNGGWIPAASGSFGEQIKTHCRRRTHNNEKVR